MRGALIGLLLVPVIAACGGGTLALSHTETACITPGQTVKLDTTTEPGATLSYKIQDDFGGDIGSLPTITAGADGKASTTWQSPPTLSTTTLHFILNAQHGDKRYSRDIHVVVGGNGRSC
jgi:hypothetical protein